MCTWRGSYLESDEFYLRASHILSCIQTPVNIFGTFIIVLKTPKNMEKVKISILLMHSTCFWLDIYFNILSIPYMIHSAAAGYPLGILFHLGVPTDIMIYFGLVSVFFFIPAIILFFEERYNRLVRSDADSHSRFLKRVAHFGIMYLSAIIGTLVVFFGATTDSDETKRKMLERFPCLPPEIITKPGFLILTEDTLALVVILLVLTFFTFFQLGYFFGMTANFLYTTKTMSANTAKLQKQLFQRLTIQIVVPLFAVFIPCIYLNGSAAFHYLDMIFINFSNLFISTHGLLSCVTTILVHKAYRDAVFEMFGAGCLMKKDLRSRSFVTGTVRNGWARQTNGEGPKEPKNYPIAGRTPVL